MSSLILFFALLSSGSVLSSAFWQKRFEETLPITCSCIVFIIFVCGIMGQLALGAVVACALAVAAYIAAIIWMWAKHEWPTFIKCFFTPAFFMFVCFYCLLIYTNMGKLASMWDEFSHWMDTVKATTQLDDFGTNPMSVSFFQSYPPGMTLFQYMLQKLYQWTSGNVLSEWRAYFAFQIFALSMFFPLMNRLQFKKPLGVIVSAAIIFLSPLFFFSTIYNNVQIDPILSIAFGTGMAIVFLRRERSLISAIQIMSYCAILVLLKDSGLFFALCLGLTFIGTAWFDQQENVYATRQRKVIESVCVVLAIMLPKLLWKYHLSARNAILAFSEPYDPSLLLRVVLGLDHTYRATVWTNFIQAVLTRTVALGTTGIALTYFSLGFLLLALAGAAMLLFHRKKQSSKRRISIFTVVIVCCFVLYTLGLGFTYITRYTEYEATRLAAFSRYLNTLYSGIWIFVVTLVMGFLQEFDHSSGTWTAAVLSILMMITPMSAVSNYLSRVNIDQSISVRKEWTAICEKIERYIPDNASVTLVAQEDNGWSYYALHYLIRPRRLTAWSGWNINEPYYENDHWIATVQSSWSIGEPFYDGDIWTATLSADQWQRILMEHFEYVVLYQLNDYFYEHFSSVFANPDDIAEQEIYWLNPETGLLERCSAEEM